MQKERRFIYYNVVLCLGINSRMVSANIHFVLFISLFLCLSLSLSLSLSLTHTLSRLPLGLHSIELQVLDKVELGHVIVASVVVLNTRGIPLPSSLHPVMGLKVGPSLYVSLPRWIV